MATIFVTEDLDEIMGILKQAIDDHDTPLVVIPGTDDFLLYKSAANLLISFGIQPNRIGFKQLQLAITLYVQNPTQSLSKELYPAIAKQFGSSSKNIERSIRAAISTAWEIRNKDTWNVFSIYNAPPSNKLFIATLAQLLG